jgi:hypothetical protein
MEILKELGIEESGIVNPETAAKVGKLAGVQYVVYGEVEGAGYSVESYRNKRGEVMWHEATGRVVAHHVITDVEKGRIWKEIRDEATEKTTYYKGYPDEATLQSLCQQACNSSAASFVRQLVPTAEGRVIGKTNGAVIVNLGRKHGVGLDTDIRFYRYEESRDESGEVIKDPTTGEPLRSKVPVQAIARKGHKEPSPCIGRPIQVDESHCIVQVGYYGKTPYNLDPSPLPYTFKPSDLCYAAVKKDDIAVLSPRRGDAY